MNPFKIVISFYLDPDVDLFLKTAMAVCGLSVLGLLAGLVALFIYAPLFTSIIVAVPVVWGSFARVLHYLEHRT